MIAGTETTLELQRQAIQEALDAERPAKDRNRLGQFATPNALAVDIARYVRSIAGRHLGTVRFADPSIGSGSFFSAALNVFGSSRIESATGIELDPRFCNAAKELWEQKGLRVISGDFTRIIARQRKPASPNLILANPPYVRHHHLTREDKQRLKELAERLTGVKVGGLAGLYVYFLLLATAWMEEGGYAAWLIPSEFMDVNYGDALKRFLTDRIELIRVHRFDPGDVQFGDALVSSAVVVFRKTAPAPGHAAEFTFGGTLQKAAAVERVPSERLRESRKWTAFPTHAGNDRRVSVNPGDSTLGDFFRIQRGIATGGNKFFILTRQDALRQGLPENCLKPILPSPRYLKTTEIRADETGYPLVEPQLCVIDCDLPEEIIRERHPALWSYLESAQAQGVLDGYIVSKRSPWYRQERRAAAPFLCTYMGRGAENAKPFRFIWNRSCAIATNLYLMLYPQNALARMLQAHPKRAADVFLLLGDVTGNELRGQGRVYGGGLNKIEPNELARIGAAPFVSMWPELEPAARRQGKLFG